MSGSGTPTTYDIAVVGSGPGGYVTALRAAQLGLEVGLVEERELGGVCLNRGCIPTKAMLEVAALVHQARAATESGLLVEGAPAVDYAAALKHRDRVVKRLMKGVAGLLEHAGVAVHEGRATLARPGTLSVAATGGSSTSEETTIPATSIVIATGSVPAPPPVPGAHHPRVLDSDGALALDHVPHRLIVLGGGAIGCEWSTIFSRLGSQVTLIEMLPSLLPRTEPELGRLLAKTLQTEGVDIRTNTTLESIEGDDERVRVVLAGDGAAGSEETIDADYVLTAVGRMPNTAGLGLEAAGVDTGTGGWIEIDQYCRTSAASVYAIGDVTGGPLFAHVASRQGVIVAETLAGLSPKPIRVDRIPAVTFTDPEIAGVGLTEDEAADKGFDVQVGRFPLSASGKAVAIGHDTGMVKIVAERRFGRVLGCHIAGPNAGDLLAEAVLALDLEATLAELTSVIRSHPTLSEAVGEAAMAAEGGALHYI